MKISQTERANAAPCPTAPNTKAEQVRTRRVEELISPVLREQSHLWVKTAFGLNNVFYTFMEVAAAVLSDYAMDRALVTGDDREAEVGFRMDHIFELGITIKRCDDAEKEGNINLRMDIADDCPLNMKDFVKILAPVQDDLGRTTMVYQPAEENRKVLEQIAKKTAHELYNKFQMLFSDTNDILTIVAAFFVGVVEVILTECSELNIRKRSFNCMDSLEFMVKISGEPVDTANIKLNIGEAMKLRVKHDAITERN